MLKVQRIPVGAYDVTIEMVKPSPQQLCKSYKLALTNPESNLKWTIMGENGRSERLKVDCQVSN